MIPLSYENREAANRNGAIVSATLRPYLRGWSDRLNALVASPLPVPLKLKGLYKVAGEITALAAPFAACKSGCSACCHMATMVALPEAQLMAESIGVKMRMPVKWMPSPFDDDATEKRDEFAASFHDTPRACPFLIDRKCSIYEHRPLACRIHLNMAANAEPCQMDQARESATLDLISLDHAYALICRTLRYQDIREYFPRGMRK